jgi:choline dehydrogenase-like flavoprotein
MNKLGWHWWPSDTAVATTDYEGRGRCINLGHCTPAARRAPRPAPTSPIGRTRSAPASSCAPAPGARDHDQRGGMASGAIYYDPDGVEHFQPAEVVIMACNGVGTPRLLLNSQVRAFPNGLANSSGLVGKNLMFHPYAHIYGYVDEPFDGNTAAQLLCGARNSTRPTRSRGFVRGYTCSSRAAPA